MSTDFRNSFSSECSEAISFLRFSTVWSNTPRGTQFSVEQQQVFTWMAVSWQIFPHVDSGDVEVDGVCDDEVEEDVRLLEEAEGQVEILDSAASVSWPWL